MPPSRRPSNYGWDVYEGTHELQREQEPERAGRSSRRTRSTRHSDGCSITGGYVWKGRYYYGDYCSGRVWSLKVVGGKATDERAESINVPSLSSWGLDGRGNLYAASLDGVVYRITA